MSGSRLDRRVPPSSPGDLHPSDQAGLNSDRRVNATQVAVLDVLADDCACFDQCRLACANLSRSRRRRTNVASDAPCILVDLPCVEIKEVPPGRPCLQTKLLRRYVERRESVAKEHALP